MRKAFRINGIVQGVGFRPFVAKIAKDLGLTGFVLNSGHGVLIEVQGDSSLIDQFEEKLNKEKPHESIFIEFTTWECEEIQGEREFVILASEHEKDVYTFIPPDLATCPDCVEEILDSTSRRYLYPLTNCTNCGPRYTVIEKLPYDRPNTSMKEFPLCEDCYKEYTDHRDRRYHAQPVACPNCGPNTYLLTKEGTHVPDPDLRKTVQLLKEGNVVSVKSLGGYLLVCDAFNESAVQRLRQLKKRPQEPFALMATLSNVEKLCFTSSFERELLESAAAPIVLLKKKPNVALPEVVAPGQNYLGFMVPYTPLHHIIFHHWPEAVLVMTSANLHGEVIYYEDSDLPKLLKMAGYVLTHDRAIVTHVDDSVVQVLNDVPHIIRRSRGYVPLPIKLSTQCKVPILATGGDEKSTPALAKNGYAILGQYIGDLKNVRTMQTYVKVIDHLRELFDIEPQIVVTDKHPGYLSHEFAYSLGLPVMEVQHHVAHALSAMEENQLSKAVAVVYDGTGYGDDETLWGSEVLFLEDTSYQRLFHFDYIPLVGGEKAIEEPWRLAASLLEPDEAEKFFGRKGRQIALLSKEASFPLACGMGRIFDTLSALLGICTITTYEGEPAQKLQMVAEKSLEKGDFADNVSIKGSVVSTKDIIQNTLELVRRGYEATDIARLFHNTIAKLTVKLAENVGYETVVITGGSFQNSILYNTVREHLEKTGMQVFRNRQVPMNDNGIALGQIAYVLRRKDNVFGNTHVSGGNTREQSVSILHERPQRN